MVTYKAILLHAVFYDLSLMFEEMVAAVNLNVRERGREEVAALCRKSRYEDLPSLYSSAHNTKVINLYNGS
jgi:hypothetical protein